MNIMINVSDFKDAVEAIWLKGKYKSSTTSKTDVVSNSCLCVLKTNQIAFYNGNDKCALNVNKTVEYPCPEGEEKMFIFDIEKAMKYLKTFKGDLYLRLTDSNLIMKCNGSSARIPLLVEHNAIGLISKIINIDIKPPVVFGKTELPCQLMFNGKAFADAIKFCNVVGTATFKINYNADSPKAIVSSRSFNRTEKASQSFVVINPNEESMTVEFSAPLDKFCNDEVMTIFSGDDKPILLIGTDRKLVIAPYVR